MNKTFKKKWVKALRSGKYEQGNGVLRMKEDGEDKFCCLGVACDLLRPNLWKDYGDQFAIRMKTGYESSSGESMGFMPEELAEEIGIDYATQTMLANMNDDAIDSSFDDIANFIEKNL